MKKSNAAPLAAQDALTHISQAHGQTETITYQCRLITHMYGGGVEAGTVDTTMPIRATAIRGQLREWWRRLNRKHHANTKKLFEAERAIWGGLGDADTLAASKVRVVVQPMGHLDPKTSKFAVKQGDPEHYALFAAAEQRGGPNQRPAAHLLVPPYAFRLVLHLDQALAQSGHKKEVLDAVRWWATFGGVGARTRRGCGAVVVKDEKNNLVCVNEQEVATQGWKLVLRGGTVDAEAAWKDAVGALKDFRQKEDFARNKGKEPTNPSEKHHPGRSRWPEPDAIRRITGRNSPDHKPQHAAGDVYPRAAFGLPIIFHFKDQGEPADATLKPVPEGTEKTAERMASPLILRPYPANNEGKLWRAAALLLDTAHITHMGISLEGKERGLPHALTAGRWQPKGDAVAAITPLAGDANVLAAFLDYFTQGKGEQSAVTTAAIPSARPVGTVPVEGVRLRLNKGNRALMAENPKTRRSYTAIRPAALALFAGLSEKARAELENGRFMTCDIEANGRDIVSIKEQA